MNIQQLRIIAEASRQNFNFTAVARALYISQPAISKSIKEFEDELGVELFIRKGKRVLGFTEVGNRLLGLAEEILGNVRKIKSLKNEFFDFRITNKIIEINLLINFLNPKKINTFFNF